MKTYHISRGGQTLGPYDGQQIFDLLKSHQLALEDLSAVNGDTEWTPLAQRLGPKALAKLTSPQSPSRRRFRFLRVVAVALIAFLGLCFWAAQSNRRPRSTAQAHPAEQHYANATGYVRDHLKAPSTAKFSTLAESECREIGNGIWEAFGSVDSQNSFGAMLRARWRLVFEGDTRRVLFMRIGKDDTGDLDAAMLRAVAGQKKGKQ